MHVSVVVISTLHSDIKGGKHSKVSKNAHLKLFACNLKAYLITNWNLMLLY